MKFFKRMEAARMFDVRRAFKMMCLLSMAAVRGQLNTPIFTGEPLEINLFDNEAWKMDLKIEFWNSSSDPDVAAKFYFQMSVSRKPKSDGSYETFPEGTVV